MPIPFLPLLNLPTPTTDAPLAHIPLALAPMAAISDMPFRKICLELGANWAPTELLSDEGLRRRQKHTMLYLRHDESLDRPFVVQIFGHRPEAMGEAAKVAVDQGADVIDLNMGCPAAKVVKGGSGSALMKTPELAANIVETVRHALPDIIPVTVKFRSGWDDDHLNAVEFAKLMERAGASLIAVHARTRAQAYAGKADWGVIARVKEAVSIPVIGNGDVSSRELMERMIRETKCDGVMIGRGAMGNPWIFRECRNGLPPTRSERGQLIRRHLLEHLDFCGLTQVSAIHAFRTQLACYAKGLYGATAFRNEVMHIDDLLELLDKIDAFFSDDARSLSEVEAESRRISPTSSGESVPTFFTGDVGENSSSASSESAVVSTARGSVSAIWEEADPDDEKFMDEALAEADLAAEEGEIPIGAVAVFQGQVIARAHNRRENDKDPTAHAELLAIQRAAQKLGAWRLSGVTLYVTLEPCCMCAGAIVLSRVDRVVFGISDLKAGATGSLMNLIQDDRLNHRARLTRGVRAEKCREKIQNFFRALRKNLAIRRAVFADGSSSKD